MQAFQYVHTINIYIRIARIRFKNKRATTAQEACTLRETWLTVIA